MSTVILMLSRRLAMWPEIRRPHAPPSVFGRTIPPARTVSNTANAFLPEPKEFKVLLDNQTLYITEDLATALGWTPAGSAASTQLSLSGWAPHYFAITPAGTASDRLARATVASSRSPNAKVVLDYLKDR
ncbi:uncharacterized protein FIBRA_06936 [Fibroporia radiculosa]|uniref:Uncharacterized protein n=1 Tax=Fibroporia radiculosa TaxID=599839 RepID=J4IBJ0_9APHY|nr:uncharacterized protein FIBRA_06936 [Fibroporia radiculosa]CCM04746.1 predicted protein [Fibroporia radiculosa]